MESSLYAPRIAQTWEFTPTAVVHQLSDRIMIDKTGYFPILSFVLIHRPSDSKATLLMPWDILTRSDSLTTSLLYTVQCIKLYFEGESSFCQQLDLLLEHQNCSHGGAFPKALVGFLQLDEPYWWNLYSIIMFQCYCSRWQCFLFYKATSRSIMMTCRVT